MNSYMSCCVYNLLGKAQIGVDLILVSTEALLLDGGSIA